MVNILVLHQLFDQFNLPFPRILPKLPKMLGKNIARRTLLNICAPISSGKKSFFRPNAGIQEKFCKYSNLYIINLLSGTGHKKEYWVISPSCQSNTGSHIFYFLFNISDKRSPISRCVFEPYK